MKHAKQQLDKIYSAMTHASSPPTSDPDSKSSQASCKSTDSSLPETVWLSGLLKIHMHFQDKSEKKKKRKNLFEKKRWEQYLTHLSKIGDRNYLFKLDFILRRDRSKSLFFFFFPPISCWVTGLMRAVWWPTEPLTISVGQVYYLQPKKALFIVCILELITDVFCKSKTDQNNLKSMRIDIFPYQLVHSSWGILITFISVQIQGEFQLFF